MSVAFPLTNLSLTTVCNAYNKVNKNLTSLYGVDYYDINSTKYTVASSGSINLGQFRGRYTSISSGTISGYDQDYNKTYDDGLFVQAGIICGVGYSGTYKYVSTNVISLVLSFSVTSGNIGSSRGDRVTNFSISYSIDGGPTINRFSNPDTVTIGQINTSLTVFVSGQSYNDSGATANKSITRTYTVVNGVLT